MEQPGKQANANEDDGRIAARLHSSITYGIQVNTPHNSSSHDPSSHDPSPHNPPPQSLNETTNSILQDVARLRSLVVANFPPLATHFTRCRTFPKFSRLPAEIQLMIWKYAVPCPREFFDIFLVIVNFDLDNPRAIILSPTEYSQIQDMFGVNNRRGPYKAERQWPVRQLDVISLLHACRNSRTVAGGIFCLDIESNTWNKSLWDPETDTVYLASASGWSYRSRCLLLYWLSRKREQPHPSLVSTQHIALKLDTLLMRAMRVLLPFNAHPPITWDDCWLENLPALQSFDLCIDPVDVSEKDEGSVLLYEPHDVPVWQLHHFLPSTIQKKFSERFEDSARELGMEVPLVEVSVLCWKKPQSRKSRKD